MIRFIRTSLRSTFLYPMLHPVDDGKRGTVGSGGSILNLRDDGERGPIPMTL